jgi:hypothetical protein
LQGAMANGLHAISGAVFTVAASYISEAANFVFKSNAQAEAVPRPGFFGFMRGAAGFLLPLFDLITVLFFSGQRRTLRHLCRVGSTTEQLRHTAALPLHKNAPNHCQLNTKVAPVYLR